MRAVPDGDACQGHARRAPVRQGLTRKPANRPSMVMPSAPQMGERPRSDPSGARFLRLSNSRHTLNAIAAPTGRLGSALAVCQAALFEYRSRAPSSHRWALWDQLCKPRPQCLPAVVRHAARLGLRHTLEQGPKCLLACLPSTGHTRPTPVNAALLLAGRSQVAAL